MLLLVLWDGGRRVFATEAGRSPGWDWIVLAYLIGSVALAILLPRALQQPRAVTRGGASGLFVDGIPCAVAMAPFLLSFAPWPWAPTLGP